MKEKIQNWDKLGFMELDMCHEMLRGSGLANFAISYGCLGYIHMYKHSTLGGNNLSFCVKGWYVLWENENYKFVVACVSITFGH